MSTQLQGWRLGLRGPCSAPGPPSQVVPGAGLVRTHPRKVNPAPGPSADQHPREPALRALG